MHRIQAVCTVFRLSIITIANQKLIPSKWGDCGSQSETSFVASSSDGMFASRSLCSSHIRLCWDYSESYGMKTDKYCYNETDLIVWKSIFHFNNSKKKKKIQKILNIQTKVKDMKKQKTTTKKKKPQMNYIITIQYSCHVFVLTTKKKSFFLLRKITLKQILS